MNGDGLDWRMMGVLATLFVAWSALLFGMIRWLLNRYQSHMDEKFDGLERGRNETERYARQLEQKLMELIASLPRDYVMREDWIRFAGVIDAKMDRLGNLMNELLRGQNERRN